MRVLWLLGDEQILKIRLFVFTHGAQERRDINLLTT